MVQKTKLISPKLSQVSHRNSAFRAQAPFAFSGLDRHLILSNTRRLGAAQIIAEANRPRCRHASISA
jgi:hypothetical protein